MDKRTNFTLIYPKGKFELCEIIHKRIYIKEHIFYYKFIFIPNKGYDLLIKTIKEKPDKINLLSIVNNEYKEYTIEKFFNILEYCALK